MYKRLVFTLGVALLALTASPVFADDTTEDTLVCTKAEQAAAGAAAMRSLHLLDGRAIRITHALLEKKECWFEPVSIPKKYTPLASLTLEKGYTHAYVVFALEIKGVMRYVVYFEEGTHLTDA